MRHLGIDIGTTTVCCTVLGDNRESLGSFTKKNNSFIETEYDWEKIQDPQLILDTVFDILKDVTGNSDDITSIGVTGQMHGILYTNAEGRHVSPLYTWQDGRGSLTVSGGKSYAEQMLGLTGKKLFSGYGLLTHYYNIKNGLVPKGAKKLCTIADYLVMRLCGLSEPYMHTGNAASLGCFDLKKLCFDTAAAEKCGIDTDMLPAVTDTAAVAGYFRGIPVIVAIGDNQASFIGSGADGDAVLVNIGTGSQISLIGEYTELGGDIECRPFNDGKYLLVGSSLNGGRAYAELELLFRKIARMAGAEVNSMYAYMDKALEKYSGEDTLEVCTVFNGSRDFPDLRGSISNIGTSNFTPEQLMLGFARGICNELYGMHSRMNVPEKGRLIGSGNGIRSNKALCASVEKCFGKKLLISGNKEEAACGAAMFGIR